MGKEEIKEAARLAKEERLAEKRAKKIHAIEAKERSEKRGANKTSIWRLTIVGLVLLITVVAIVLLYIYLDNTFAIIYVIFRIIAVLVVLTLFGREWNSAFKLPWIMFILLTPVVGGSLYLMLGRRGTTGRRMEKRYSLIRKDIRPNFASNPDLIEKFKYTKPSLYHELYYINNVGGYPGFQNTDVSYFPEGKLGLESQIEAMKKAEKFIFFEYHAIENQIAFERIKEVMFQKAKEGVEVRIFYDDMGSVGFLDKKFKKEMEENHIQCRIFNEFSPLKVFFINNRDHRKITVIDGKVGYTGGYNMADEYFDIIHPFGEWKDTGIKLVGPAVNSLTLIFLENWNGIEHTDSAEDIKKYIVDNSNYEAEEKDGVIIPYADGPIDREPMAESVYLNLIRDAKRFIFISTPYLLITDDMTRELCDAVKRGVDVRLVTPGIPDKKIVYRMTRSYYMSLAKAGVKIYEYKPGFVHAKMMLVDDEIATVGTINFDYRSLYHHFENACLISGYKCLHDIHEDFMDMMKKSRYVTNFHAKKKHLTLLEIILRLFAPLM